MKLTTMKPDHLYYLTMVDDNKDGPKKITGVFIPTRVENLNNAPGEHPHIYGYFTRDPETLRQTLNHLLRKATSHSEEHYLMDNLHHVIYSSKHPQLRHSISGSEYHIVDILEICMDREGETTQEPLVKSIPEVKNVYVLKTFLGNGDIKTELLYVHKILKNTITGYLIHDDDDLELVKEVLTNSTVKTFKPSQLLRVDDLYRSYIKYGTDYFEDLEEQKIAFYKTKN